MREISLINLVKAILSKLWLVILCAVIFAAGAYVYAKKTTVPTYKSESLIFISNYDKGQTAQSQMSAASMEASEHVLARYVVLMEKVDKIYETAIANIDTAKEGYLSGVEGYEQFEFLFENESALANIEELRLKYQSGEMEYDELLELLDDKKFSIGQLKSMISFGQNRETEILSIFATSNDPRIAQIVSQAVTESLIIEASGLLGGSKASLVQGAKAPIGPSSPVKQYTYIGGFIGALLIVFIVVLTIVFDVTVRTENDLSETFPEIPILGVVPDIDSVSSKKGYKHSQRNE